MMVVSRSLESVQAHPNGKYRIMEVQRSRHGLTADEMLDGGDGLIADQLALLPILDDDQLGDGATTGQASREFRLFVDIDHTVNDTSSRFTLGITSRFIRLHGPHQDAETRTTNGLPVWTESCLPILPRGIIGYCIGNCGTT
jgi:hypothetical protein